MTASPAPAGRSRLINAAPLVLALAAIAVAYGQMALNLGLTPQAFSRPGDATLRAAPFAFGIWGLIYTGLVALGVFEVLPAGARSPAAGALRGPAIAALAGITAWVVASAANWRWVTIALIVASCAALVIPLVRERRRLAQAVGAERVLAVWPLALLAGWLTVASVLNILNVLTAEGVIAPAARLAWADGGVLAAVVIAVAVTAAARLWIYALPVAWGLFGVFAAERADGDLDRAWPALAGALVVLAAAALVWARGHRGKAI